MAEVINTNVIENGKKFVDFSGLDYFWTKAKTYIDGVDASMSAKVVALENTVGDSTKGLVNKVNLIQSELDGLNGGAGSITTQIENAIANLDLPNTYEAKGEAAKAEAAAKSYAEGLVMADGVSKFDAAGAAAQALTDAKSYVDGKVDGKFDAAGTAAGLNDAMDARVKVLEGIDHDKIAADAAAAAVAGVIDDAPEKFDTLKEIAAWIAEADTAEDAASLVTRVSALEAIDHDAYVAADETVLASAKSYADGLVMVDGAAKFDAAGAAAQALADAKDYADGKFQVAGNYEAAGAAAQALADAKDYADGKFQVAGNYEAAGTAAAAIEALKLAETYDAKGAAADAQAAAIAQAKLDAAEALKSYYTKTEVDNLLSTNSVADQAYAKTYTDELFSSMQFAQNSEIDALFA
jgi:hypothetical protein